MITTLLVTSMLTFFVFAVGLAGAQEHPVRSAPEAQISSMASSGDSLRYGRHGSMRAQPGQRDAVIDMLLEVAERLKSAGCLLYVVSRAPEDPDLILVTEVWESSELHQASLELPAVREAIGHAMPMLTGDFTAEEFDVVGGLGLP